MKCQGWGWGRGAGARAPAARASARRRRGSRGCRGEGTRGEGVGAKAPGLEGVPGRECRTRAPGRGAQGAGRRGRGHRDLGCQGLSGGVQDACCPFAIASTRWQTQRMRNVTVNSIGEYIREQREQAKISMRQLAQSAGVSNPYLSQIERGLRKPSADILQQIAKGLRISAEALYVQAGILEDRPRTRASGPPCWPTRSSPNGRSKCSWRSTSRSAGRTRPPPRAPGQP